MNNNADSGSDDDMNEEILDIIDVNEDDAEAVEDSDGEEAGMEDEAAGAASEPSKDDAEVIFSGHKEPVFCIRVDPKSCVLAVSGGQDDKACVWNISTGETLFECTGHKDSVTSVGWSHDGVYVATADLSGIVKVWKTETKKEVLSCECGDIEWLQWHHSAHVLLVGTVDGDLWMWMVPSGTCKTFPSSGAAALVGRILSDGKQACVGYEDGKLRIWDMKSGTALHTISGHDAHQKPVVCLDCKGDSLALSGSTDMTAKLVNTSTGKVLATFNCAGKKGSSIQTEDKASADETDDSQNSVESVGLATGMQYAATGTLSGVLGIWDISSQTLRHMCKHETGIVKLQWDSIAPLVYTACLDGIVRLWDSRTGQSEAKWQGHKADILDFDISRDGNYLASASEDTTARIFSLHSPDR